MRFPWECFAVICWIDAKDRIAPRVIEPEAEDCVKFVTPSTTIPLVASLVLQTICSAFQLPVSPEVKEENIAKGQRLLQGMIAARESIRSAECSVESRHERIAMEKCQYQCLFDHKQDLLRFEHFSDLHERTVFVRTPTEAFQYAEQSTTIELLNPKSAIALPRAEPFDPRAIGIQGYGAFTSRRRWEDFRADLSKLSVRDVQADPQDAGLTVLRSCLRMVFPQGSGVR